MVAKHYLYSTSKVECCVMCRFEKAFSLLSSNDVATRYDDRIRSYSGRVGVVPARKLMLAMPSAKGAIEETEQTVWKAQYQLFRCQHDVSLVGFRMSLPGSSRFEVEGQC